MAKVTYFSIETIGSVVGLTLIQYPLIPGHEAAGIVAAVGQRVTHVKIGDNVTIDPMEPCRSCFHCIRGKSLLCEAMTGYGGNGKKTAS